MARDSRLFARFDLDYADHPKIGDLSDAAFRAHVELILYSRKYMTDGIIPKRVANRVGFESLSELCSNDAESPSLSRNDDGSYTLHGYADMNETRDEIEARTRRNSRNGAKGGRPPKQVGNPEETQSVSQSVSETEPSRKAETETETETEVNPPKAPQGGKRKGTRLDSDWMPTTDLVQQMQAECPDVDLKSEHRIFVDYWIAQPGQKGVKVDWPATWRNWMRRKQGDRKVPPKTFGQQRQDNTLSLIEQLREEEARGEIGDGATGRVRAIDSGR